MKKEKEFDPEKIIKTLTTPQKDALYRALWKPYVIEDAEGVLRERNVSSPELIHDISEYVASRYVNDGDYDCNLSYWDNIDNLIHEYEIYNDVEL